MGSDRVRKIRHISQWERDARQIGSSIRLCRRANKLSQAKLIAIAVSIPGGETLYRQLISNIETGIRQPSITEIKAIAQALGVNHHDWI